METNKHFSQISLEIQNKTIQILKSCNKNQLLWIYERYFNKVYSTFKSQYSPIMYLYEQNLQKEIPPGSFSDIIVMNVEMESLKDKKLYDEYILTKSLEYLKS